MARPTRVKIKRGDDWVYTDELDDIREAEAQEQKEAYRPAPIVISSLPPRAALDDELPYDQLVFEHPEVRPYITAEGRIRMGLSPEQHCIAEQIIARYKAKKKTVKKTTKRKKVAKRRSKAC